MKKFFFILLCLCLLSPLWADTDAKKDVVIISLNDEIDNDLSGQLGRRLALVKPEQTRIIILEIDTPGGYVSSGLDMCKKMDSIRDQGIEIYAYITGYAWSCGALISLACNRIYMKEQSSIGSAEVKILTSSGPVTADEKYISAFRAHFRAYAEHNNYPIALSEAMVDKKLEVYEVIENGKTTYITREEFKKNFGSDESKEPPHNIIVAEGTLANFTAKEAKKYGFCNEIVQSREDLLKLLEIKEENVVVLGTSLNDRMADFLSSSWLKGLLIIIGLAGIVIECITPGFGVPGIIGIISLSLAFTMGYIAETTAIWEILLFIVGLILLALEIFVIPGFGVAGISGIICCILALILSFQPFVLPQTDAENSLFITNIIIVLGGLLLSFGIVATFIHFSPKSAPLRRLSLATVQNPEKGYSVAITSFQALQNKEGVATSTLRPAGKAKIEDEIYDVCTSGDFLPEGTAVKVIEIRGNQIFVERA